ncbi:hypothetical protein DYB32_008377 [Aphanomyces invadans]|uniref:Pirin N-terminal domain-containing protein n=1 Tax=Aphanomyces invadans TaxID=157072 RepID=A0A418AL73_9STRA|nr:hypothetical protein DYB32_008377 [Aphanomyces invadans]
MLRRLDPFLMLDEFHVAISGGFPDHSHHGFETITYLLPHSPGIILLEYFCGHKGELAPGDLQWICPGRGIVHAEMPASRDAPAIGLQLWLNLPARLKMTDPKYQEIPAMEGTPTKQTIQESFRGASTSRTYKTYQTQFEAFCTSQKNGLNPVVAS